MREAAVQAFLGDAGADLSAVKRLVAEGRVHREVHHGETYLVRRLRKPARRK
jgi:hypothetical protein